ESTVPCPLQCIVHRAIRPDRRQIYGMGKRETWRYNGITAAGRAAFIGFAILRLGAYLEPSAWVVTCRRPDPPGRGVIAGHGRKLSFISCGRSPLSGRLCIPATFRPFSLCLERFSPLILHVTKHPPPSSGTARSPRW